MAIVFCDVNATGLNDGTTWENAYTSLQTAINNATPTTDQVWVKEGTFSISAIINCVSGVDIYGGFNSGLTGTSGSIAGRDYWVDQTILDGGGTSQLMLMATSVTIDGVVFYDGFSPAFSGGISANNDIYSITNCIFDSCNSTGTSTTNGGAAVRQTNNSSGTYTNCRFSDCTSGRYGGAVHSRLTSTFTAIDCEFTNNTAYVWGGAIYSDSSTVVCEGSSFSYNSSTTDVGGALYLGSSITNTIKRCKFDNNTSFLNGGAIWSDGPATIKECLFTANESSTGAGGAIYKFRAPSSGQMDVINCTFNGNLSFSGGNAIDGDSTCVVKNGNVWNTSSGINTGVTVTYSNVEGGYTGTGNKNSNPLFCGVGDDPYDLCIGSPCIDCADANAPAETTDILGRVRYDDPFTPNTGVGTPPYVDMGCYEYSGSKFEFVDLGTLI